MLSGRHAGERRPATEGRRELGGNNHACVACQRSRVCPHGRQSHDESGRQCCRGCGGGGVQAGKGREGGMHAVGTRISEEVTARGRAAPRGEHSVGRLLSSRCDEQGRPAHIQLCGRFRSLCGTQMHSGLPLPPPWGAAGAGC